MNLQTSTHTQVLKWGCKGEGPKALDNEASKAHACPGVKMGPNDKAINPYKH